MEKRVPTRKKALVKVTKTRLDVFMIEYDQDREFRTRLARVLEEVRDNEKSRLLAIFQEYLPFIPETRLDDLKKQLK